MDTNKDKNMNATETTPATIVPNGTFTLTNPVSGGYRTFRVRTWNKECRFCNGKGETAGRTCNKCDGTGKDRARVIELLAGPSNESDYQGFGFIDDRGVRVWGRLKGTQFDALARCFWSAMTGRMAGSIDIQESRSCLRCNRKLTTPESIARGIGPECASKGW